MVWTGLVVASPVWFSQWCCREHGCASLPWSLSLGSSGRAPCRGFAGRTVTAPHTDWGSAPPYRGVAPHRPPAAGQTALSGRLHLETPSREGAWGPLSLRGPLKGQSLGAARLRVTRVPQLLVLRHSPSSDGLQTTPAALTRPGMTAEPGRSWAPSLLACPACFSLRCVFPGS